MRYGWRCNDDCRSEQGRADTTEHIAFHHSDPPTIDVGCWPPPPRAKITTATNAGKDSDKQTIQNIQMTNTTVSDKKVSI
jgi:hypothetical protein